MKTAKMNRAFIFEKDANEVVPTERRDYFVMKRRLFNIRPKAHKLSWRTDTQSVVDLTLSSTKSGSKWSGQAMLPPLAHAPFACCFFPLDRFV
jgi:hypothetical protein